MPLPGPPIAAGRTAEIYAWENNCILKLTRPEFPAHLADQEWRQSEQAWKLGAPAPRPVALIDVDGRRGVIFQRIDGPNMVQWMQGHLERLDPCARQLGSLHAELHKLRAPEFPSIHQRVHGKISQDTLIGEEGKAAIFALLERLPEDDTLCHADFHPENILMASLGPVVIDWEGSLRGEPGADVARTWLWIRTGITLNNGRGGWLFKIIGRRFENVYLSAYRRIHGPLDHLPEWMAIQAACHMDKENQRFFAAFEQIIRGVIPSWPASK